MNDSDHYTDGVERTTEEIVTRIESITDTLGFRYEVLIRHLPYQHAMKYLKDDVSEDEWRESRADVKPPADAARDYLDFAWGKANGQRGISANRSVDKIGEWLWLAGMDEALEEFESAPYPEYGKPKLRVAERYLQPGTDRGESEVNDS